MSGIRLNSGIVETANDRTLKFDCRECSFGPSIAKSEFCMRETLRRLSQWPSVNKIILDSDYVREYSGKDLEILKEFARLLEDSVYLVLKCLKVEDCGSCLEDRKSQIDEIWDKLRGDPSQGIVELERLKLDLEKRSKRGSEQCKRCRKILLNKGLRPALAMLGGTPLVSEVGSQEGRSGYDKLIRPSVRPSFLRSKIRLKPPVGAELVDAYELEGGKTRIYCFPEELSHLYFLIPMDYRLSPEKVRLLQEARRKLLNQHGNLKLKIAREEIEHRTRKLIMDIAIQRAIDLSKKDVEGLSKCLARSTAGFGILETLLSDPHIQDIYADAPIAENPLHIYHQEFEECSTNILLTQEDAKFLASRFRAISGRPFSEADPILDLNLKGVRIAAIQRPLSPKGLALAIRRHKTTPWTLPQFVENGFLTPKAAGLLSLLIDSQSSVLIAGTRGAGKTSLLGALLLELLPRYRIICLEDTAELPLDQLRSLGFKIQSLQVQPAITGSKLELRAEDALRAALRLGESVLVVGEVRGSEAKVLYEAMRIGATGNSVMGTIHGATFRDVFERIVYDIGIPASSFKATDAIVVASPIRRKGGTGRIRRITQISEVGDEWEENPISEKGFADMMSYDPSKDRLVLDSALQKGHSSLLKSIARKWSVKPSDVNKNLDLRAKMQESLVKVAAESESPKLLGAEMVVRSNLTFHRLLEEELKEGKVRYGRVLKSWRDWLAGEVE